MELVLIRHGHAENNVVPPEQRTEVTGLGCIAGLTERGREQVKITGEWLKERFARKGRVPIDTYGFVSRIPRAIQTASILNPDLHWRQDARLNEAERGIWAQLPHTLINEKYPEELLRREALGWYWYRPLGGESWPDIENRIASWLETIERLYESHGEPTDRELRIFVVMHGAWYAGFRMLVDRVPVEDLIAHDRVLYTPIENASVSIYRRMTVEETRSRNRIWCWDFDSYTVPWQDKL